MIKRNRLTLKITSAILFVFGIFSAISFATSLFAVIGIVSQVSASKESLQLTLYALILCLLGLVSLVLQLVAGFKGWKAGSGKDYPDNCKTYGIFLFILQIISILFNVFLGSFEASQLIGNGFSLLLLFLYTYSASKLIY